VSQWGPARCPGAAAARAPVLTRMASGSAAGAEATTAPPTLWAPPPVARSPGSQLAVTLPIPVAARTLGLVAPGSRRRRTGCSPELGAHRDHLRGVHAYVMDRGCQGPQLPHRAKHAHASHVALRVRRDNGRVFVLVADDGVGGADPGGQRSHTSAGTSSGRCSVAGDIGEAPRKLERGIGRAAVARIVGETSAESRPPRHTVGSPTRSWPTPSPAATGSSAPEPGAGAADAKK
jgi:hypothetical protein